MSACKYTERISAAECIGDSLTKINANFEKLDYGLCEKATLKSGHATTAEEQTTELQDTIYRVNAQNSYVYNSRFDSLQAATHNSKTLLDGSLLDVTTFSYTDSTIVNKPLGSFTSVALTDKPPTVSLYWMASGDGLPTTVFNLNSATSTDKGAMWFNGTTTSLLSSNSKLYVGGTFTTAGSALAEKFAIIDLTTPAGNIDLTNPITNLGTVGEVKQIIEHTITLGGLPKKFLVLGGSFENIGIRGKGLLIYNVTDNVFYPFYVNGEVNALKVRNSILWVGGNFTFVNTGTSSASTFSGRRVYSNGLFTVNLNGLWAGLTTSAIEDRSSVFEPRAIINSIEYYNAESLFFVGGEFKIKESSDKIKCRNACCMYSNGSFYESWRPIINGPVYKLHLDDNIATGGSLYLYIGGEFSEIYSQTQFYLTPRLKDDHVTKFYNCAAVQLTDLGSLKTTPQIVGDWKPKFNGPVTSMLSHDNVSLSHIYFYGKQTSVNGLHSNYLVAITKASSFNRGQVVTEWLPSVQNSPSLINNALIRGASGLIIGGNFTRVGNSYRYNLAEIGDTSWSVLALSGFAWDFSAQSLANGMGFGGSTYTQRVSALPLAFDRVNVSTFAVPEDTFAGLRHGQLLKFSVRRPGSLSAVGTLSDTDDTFKQDVHVIGYKLDYN